MLTNLTPNYEEAKRRLQIAKDNNFKYTPQYDEKYVIEQGIYLCNFGFNFSHQEFIEFKDDCNIPFDQHYEIFAPDYNKAAYGVADSIEQIKEYFKEEIENTERKFFIYVTPVTQEKENKGQGGGWRWHKWGEYIGNLNPQCEYLDDEDFGDDFECVWCFSIVEVL